MLLVFGVVAKLSQVPKEKASEEKGKDLVNVVLKPSPIQKGEKQAMNIVVPYVLFILEAFCVDVLTNF